MKNRNKLFNLIIIFIVLITILLLINNHSDIFNYSYTPTNHHKLDDYEEFFNTSHADYNTEGTCYYEDYVNIKEVIKDELKPIEENITTFFSGYELYAGYFKTIDEAINFGEANYKNIDTYFYDKYQILAENMGYEYRIEEICDVDVKGYVVIFSSLEQYIMQLPVNIEKGISYIENIHNIIKEDEVLTYFNVFYISDIYLGNIMYTSN